MTTLFGWIHLKGRYMVDAVVVFAQAIKDAYPELTPGELSVALQITGILNQALVEGWDPDTIKISARGQRPNSLGAALTKLREDAGLTQRNVTEKAGWSESKLNRIEGDKVSISSVDLDFLLNVYRVKDKTLRAKLHAQAKRERDPKVRRKC